MESARITAIAAEATHWRREIHRHPELVFDVHRTASFVANLLRSFGCDEVVTGIGRTGVVGVVHGRRQSSGRVVALRADMDGLPITEATGAPHASVITGAMHACGHDGHTAILLAASKYLAETRNFDGTAVLVFQPAEEGGAGGAAMLADGLIERFAIEEIYGLHNTPGLPLGQFAIRPGAIMAAGDRFTVTVTGKGGHAAHPERCIDTVLVASQIVIALHSIVARDVDPQSPAVLSVSSLQAGNTFSVIPDTATLLGTVRTFDSETQDLIERRIDTVATSIAQAYGASAVVSYDRRVPATVNHEPQTKFMAEIASQISQTVDDTPAHMGGEDFAYMLQASPGAFIFLGNGDSEDLHEPSYDFDDAAIPFGTSLWVKLIERRMPV